MLLESWIDLSGILLHGAHTGISSNNDDEGSKNITKKRNLRPFKLYRVYLKPRNSSIVGEFSWSWILNDFIHVQTEKGLFVVVCPRPSQNVVLGGFTTWSCSGRQSNVLKCLMHVQSSCFAHKIKPIVFWRCCRRGSCLSSLITQGRRKLEWSISCKSLYFVHPSLELVPLVAFQCRLRRSNVCEVITIWLYYFLYKNT